MTLVISDDPNYKAKIITGERKREQDLQDYVTLSTKIGRRAAYKAVYGIDDPSLEEDSEESKEGLRLIKEKLDTKTKLLSGEIKNV
jgi:hypothetical protein